MSASQSLKDFLKQKKEREEAPGVDWEARKQERITAIGALFDDIERWLKPSIDEGIVSPSRERHPLFDSYMGAYESELLTLQIGHVGIQFIPVGERVAGASARVDAISGPHKLTMIYLPTQGWKILVRGPVTQTVPVTEDSFADALKELLQE